MYSADFRDLLEWDQNAPSSKVSMTATMKSADGLVRPIKLDEEEDAAELANGTDSQSDNEGDVYMSLVDGKMHSRRGHLFDKRDDVEITRVGEGIQSESARLIVDKEGVSGSRALAVTGNVVPGTSKPTLEQALIAAPAKDARDYMLRKREHNGLEVRLGMDKPMAAREGRSGIAWSYEGEGSGVVRGQGSGDVADVVAEKDAGEKMQIEDVSTSADASSLSSAPVVHHGSPTSRVEEANSVTDSSDEEGPVGGAFGLFDNLTSSSEDEEGI